MKKRRILILTNRVPYPLKDGGNLAMNAMIQGYHDAGWDVYLLSMNTTRHHVSAMQLSKLYTHLAGFEAVDVNNEVKTSELLKNLFFSKTANHVERFYVPEFVEKLEEVVANFKPDVVQVESVYLSTYLPIVKAHSGAVTVLRMHNLEYQIWHRYAKRTRSIFKKIYLTNLVSRLRSFEYKAWNDYDLLLPITETDADLLIKKHVKTNMLVAPFGIDVDKAIPVNKVEEKWVGYHIGAMDWMPNEDSISWFLNQVWPRLHKAIPQFQFYFAGRNMPESFNKLQKSGVHCMGEVADAQAFIADKKILIVPLRSGGGIRIKILEAMAAGKVIISTKTGMQGIDARAGVHYQHVHKAEDFIKAIRWCLQHKAEAEEMAQKAMQLVQRKYEQHAIIKTVIREIDSIMNPDL